jgi:hypothetical protein
LRFPLQVLLQSVQVAISIPFLTILLHFFQSI